MFLIIFDRLSGPELYGEAPGGFWEEVPQSFVQSRLSDTELSPKSKSCFYSLRRYFLKLIYKDILQNI